jgi:hypothetical protein
MRDEVWKEFFIDHDTERAFASSEVFQNYARAELAREEMRKASAIKQKLDEESELLDQLEAFKEKIASDPVLKLRFLKAKAALEANPELIKQVDPNFINGLKILNLLDEGF